MRAQGEGDACPRLVIRQQVQHCPRRRSQRYEKKPSMSIHQHQIEQVQLNKTIEQKTD